MPQFELKDVATVTARLDEVSLDAATVWRPLDDTRITEIEQNILEGNWMASAIEFPSLVGNAAGTCFEAKACQLFNFGWCRGGGAGVPMHRATHIWLTFCIVGRSNHN